MKITFHGGAGSVTGANYLVEAGGHKILVDCGLQQGGHFAEKQNFEPFAYTPSEIQGVFITHAHIDHTGRLPKLWKDGFRGKIYSTPPTRDFAELLLLDSEHLLGREADREHEPHLFDSEDVIETMKVWEGVEYHKPIRIGDVEVLFWNAGHILGSACVQIRAEGKTVLFSGDLGNYPAPIIQDTERVPRADFVIIESTYGGRTHPPVGERQKELEKALTAVLAREGVLMIPAFAMERTQDLLFHLNHLVEKGKIPRVPVFVDSPLAIKLTAVYKKYEKYFDRDVSQLIHSGDDIFNFPGLQTTLTSSESKAINEVPAPKVIIAGSGMSNGGRILHHEMRYLSDPKNMILFIGYQAEGTLGRRILEGEENVRIMGIEVAVRCERRTISSYSAHADQPRLLEWLSNISGVGQVFVVQGEEKSSAQLAEKIDQDLKLKTRIPRTGEEVVL